MGFVAFIIIHIIKIELIFFVDLRLGSIDMMIQNKSKPIMYD